VVVDVAERGCVVLVEPTPVVDVVLPPTEVVVLELGVVVDVEVVDDVGVVVVVVVVVGAGRVVVGFSKILSTVVPPPLLPKISASGLPATSSTTVTKTSVMTKTPRTASAHTRQLMPPGPDPPGAAEPPESG
jgi:hypothetical protein